MTIFRNILIALTLALLLSCQQKNQSIDPLEPLLKNNIISRDSGKKVTKEFLSSCLRSQSKFLYTIACDDVLFKHHISFYTRNQDGLPVTLIIEDGASVENRWVFMLQAGEYKDIEHNTWPNISEKTIAELLVEKTGNAKYTEEYVSSVAHSSYRVTHAATEVLDVYSGIPDDSWKTKLGQILWNGKEFEFVPDRS